jgi:hypothetical protein
VEDEKEGKRNNTPRRFSQRSFPLVLEPEQEGRGATVTVGKILQQHTTDAVGFASERQRRLYFVKEDCGGT